MNNKVTKIYELKTLGFNEIHKELQTLSKDFDNIRKSKKGAETGIVSKDDLDSVRKYREEVQKLKIQEQEFKTERQRLMAEAKAAQNLRQQEINAEREKKKSVEATAGSYAALYKQYRELYNLMKQTPEGQSVDFRGQTYQYDQAIAKLKELATAEQNWRRQWSRDSLLVGEYTSGIVQAFKQMGLDDLVGSQISRVKDRITSLDGDFLKLKTQINTVGKEGTDSFVKIEKELIDNRKEAMALRQQVAALEKEFKGVGDVGERITASIANGFKKIGSQLTSFIFQFIGISALFNKVTQEFNASIEAAEKIEGVEAAFKTINDPNLLDNLRKATRGTVDDLQLMQRAVEARNFQIPLEQLSFLLDFARRRAKETGESVDYLVNSIILGIGRKSPLILDNLGISAVRLREALKGVAEEEANVGDIAVAVAKIIQEENQKANADIETQSEKLARNKAEWVNLRTEIGTKLLPALTTLSAITLAIITNLPTLLTIVALLTAGWVIQNKTLVLLNAQLLYYNARIMLNYVALGLLSAASVAYNVVLLVLNGTLKAITAAVNLFGITIMSTTGILGFALTALALVGSALLGLSKSFAAHSKEIDRSTLKYRTLIEIQNRASEATAKEISEVELLTKIIKSNIVSQEGKKKALEDLIALSPEYLKGLTLENIATAEGKKLIDDYIKALKEKARYQAASRLRDEQVQEEVRLQTIITKLERRIVAGEATGIGSLTDEERKFISSGRDYFPFVTDLADKVRTDGRTAALMALQGIKEAREKILKDISVTDEIITDEFANLTQKAIDTPASIVEVDIARLKKDIESLDKQINTFRGSNADLKKIIADRKKLQEQLDAALGNTKNSRQKDRGSRITGQDQDRLRDIDALRDQALAEEALKRGQNLTSEEDYLRTILAINQSAITKKLSLIKGANAAERKLIADLQLDSIKFERETNEKIFDLRRDALKVQLDDAIKNEQEIAQAIQEDPTVSASKKAQAKVDADNNVLRLQERFQKQMDKLEKQYGIQSIKNAKDIADQIRKTRIQLNTNLREADVALIKDAEALLARRLAINSSDFANQREALIDSGITRAEIERRLTILKTVERYNAIRIEVESLKKQLPIYKKLLDEKKITEEQYYNFIAAMQAKQEELKNAGIDVQNSLVRRTEGIKGILTNQLNKLFNIDVNTPGGAALNAAFDATYQFAGEAMNHYFDMEEQRIRKSLELQLERLEMEKRQVLERATSQAEIESIEKQYAARKKQEEQKAYAELKKQRKAEAQIAFAVELANIAASNAKLPFPFNIAVIGLLSALATAKYAMNIQRINSAQFEKGGKVPTRGGKFGGKPHSQGGTPFEFKGQQFEAEVDELSVIRTKDAPKGQKLTISGTQEQIASALNTVGGGVSWAPGAKVDRFAYGGNLGRQLTAPRFTPSGSIINYNNTVVDITPLREDIHHLADSMNDRIDRLEVVQVTNTVTEAQQKKVKQQSVGVL